MTHTSQHHLHVIVDLHHVWRQHDFTKSLISQSSLSGGLLFAEPSCQRCLLWLAFEFLRTIRRHTSARCPYAWGLWISSWIICHEWCIAMDAAGPLPWLVRENFFVSDLFSILNGGCQAPTCFASLAVDWLKLRSPSHASCEWCIKYSVSLAQTLYGYWQSRTYLNIWWSTLCLFPLHQCTQLRRHFDGKPKSIIESNTTCHGDIAVHVRHQWPIYVSLSISYPPP